MIGAIQSDDRIHLMLSLFLHGTLQPPAVEDPGSFGGELRSTQSVRAAFP